MWRASLKSSRSHSIAFPVRALPLANGDLGDSGFKFYIEKLLLNL